jgi:hypothetical protein
MRVNPSAHISSDRVGGRQRVWVGSRQNVWVTLRPHFERRREVGCRQRRRGLSVGIS